MMRLAVAQPRVIVEPDGEENVARATTLVALAASRDVDLVLFPEGYPGPVLRRPRDTYDAGPEMRRTAAEHGVAICWSRMELCADGHHRLVVYVVDRHGTEVLRYERAHPATIPPEETQVWVAPGDGLALVEVEGVVFGIVVCSELWTPETTRVLALAGAQVILSPAGGGFTTLTDNWQTIVRARAIENHCYVAMTNNIWREEDGAAMIAGPERVETMSGIDEIQVADIDIDRIDWLRDHDDSIADPKTFDSIPGLLRARRPELYESLAKPSEDLYDYHTPR